MCSAADFPPPPMGWNTWDCFGSLVTEEQVKANADYMAEHLRPFGWDHIVIDIRWYEPHASLQEPLTDGGTRDAFGRYQPAPNRFPSAAGGRGFRPLADYLHRKGLKFGLHIMRGIPRRAVELRQPVWGATCTADQIADVTSVCPWNPDNYGIDVTKPGAQQYYDSLVALYDEWGVDFIKADDMVRQAELDAFVRALGRARPDLQLSLVGVTESTVLRSDRAVMYRICRDVWDEWDDPSTFWMGLREIFDVCARFAPSIADGSYPDADMLPLGRIGKNDAVGEDRWTRFTRDEQVMLMSLWCIARSPLMFGGNLCEMDEFTLSLLTNRELLAINQRAANSRPLFTEQARVAWAADDRAGEAKYLALFNRGDSPLTVEVDPAELGLTGRVAIRDLWQQTDLGAHEPRLAVPLRPHSSVVYRLTPV